jgi:hypothetical protein
VLADHPITVNLREDAIVEALNRWIGRRCRRLVLVSTTTGCAMVPGRPRVLTRMATSRRR